MLQWEPTRLHAVRTQLKDIALGSVGAYIREQFDAMIRLNNKKLEIASIDAVPYIQGMLAGLRFMRSMFEPPEEDAEPMDTILDTASHSTNNTYEGE